VFAPFMMLPSIARRCATQHVPVIIESEDYEAVVNEAQRTLERAGFSLRRYPASWMMRLPTRILTALAGGAVKNLVAQRLAVLRSRDLEITLHPSDLVIS